MYYVHVLPLSHHVLACMDETVKYWRNVCRYCRIKKRNIWPRGEPQTEGEKSLTLPIEDVGALMTLKLLVGFDCCLSA